MRERDASNCFPPFSLAFLILSAWLIGCAAPALAQKGRDKIDLDAIAKKTGTYSIVFEAADGFQYIYPDQRLKKNIRLDIGASPFVSQYLARRPLVPAIDPASTLKIAQTVLRTAVQLRGQGDLAHAYYLYRFVLATVLQADDLAGADIASYNVWALRFQVRMDKVPGSISLPGLDGAELPGTPPSPSTALLKLMVADAVVFHGLLARNANYSPQVLERERTPSRIRVQRRIADLARLPTNFGSHASRVLASGDPNSIPIGWVVPALEDLATRDIGDIFSAQGRIARDSHGFAAVWQLYQSLRHRLHEIEDVEELLLMLHYAKSSYELMRSYAVAAGGTFGHTISLFTVANFLPSFGRDLTSLYWHSGAREEALAMAEGLQSRAFTDWLARAHPNNRLNVRTQIPGSMGEVLPASLDEMVEVARTRQAPILYYFKTAGPYLLWTVFPDGKIESQSLALDRSDLSHVLEAFPYGSEDSPVAANVRGARGPSSGDQAGIELKRTWLGDLRRKVVPEGLFQQLKQYDRLLIVPDGLLNLVPFTALVDGEGGYFLDRFSILLSPSLTSWLVLEQSGRVRRRVSQTSGPQVLAIRGQDDVREVAIVREGRRTTVPFEPLAGATEELTRVTSILRGKIDDQFLHGPEMHVPILHLATHGFFNTDDPLDSFLVLRNGELRAQALYLGSARVAASLVVMSACQTGLGYTHPDSLLGLRNGFLVAGAHSTVATLWLISDDATVEFMDLFYRAVKEGQPLDGALRAAQLALKSKKEYADPYYWAAFQLTGIERNPI